jgi:hypothetical protein
MYNTQSTSTTKNNGSYKGKSSTTELRRKDTNATKPEEQDRAYPYKQKHLPDTIEPLVLALLLLTGWKNDLTTDGTQNGEIFEWRAWKGYPFESLDLLGDMGLILNLRKLKSVFLTEKGMKVAKNLVAKLMEIKLEDMLTA